MSAMSARRPTVSASSADSARNDVLSIDEVMDRYRGEWILMRVTRHDEGWPTHGYVTVHATTQNAMLDEMERQTESPEHARLPLHSFLADPDIYIDPSDPAAMKQFMAELLGTDRANHV
jgi:hypothetical protein